MSQRSHTESGCKPRAVAVAAILLLTVARVTDAQEMAPSAPQYDMTRFYLDAESFSTGNSDTSRLDLFLEIPFEMLTFTKVGGDFQANSEITTDIYDTMGTLVNERLWTEKIETPNYDQSVSGHIEKMSQKSLYLAPNVYRLTVRVLDSETKKSRQIKRTVVVRKFDPAAQTVSDLLLINRLDGSPEKAVVVPNVSGNIGTVRDSFFVYFEAYRKSPADSEKFVLTVHGVGGSVAERDTLTKLINPGSNPCFMRVMSRRLPAGEYAAEVSLLNPAATSGPSSPLSSTVSSHPFSIRWRGMPVVINDIDAAIDQLQYVADHDVIEAMKREPMEKKRQMFLDFWKKRDPTPQTETNELMEEYYERVAYANKNFSHYMDGWKTDRGMVYVIFGTPSNVERHPFDMDSKPYEVWTYYEINRQFVFVDATGFGDYRLQNPVWDTWRTRYR